MKYTAIVGLNYRDCKAKLNSLNPSGEPVKHTLITKPNHVQGIPFSEVIVTENANKNVNYREIMGLLSNKPIK
uniref:hypothetical protein n=1 Tax=Candidatus Electrothrix sp. TaxID=2170559 RepID=UPI00405748CF